jgi:hypothetical protein
MLKFYQQPVRADMIREISKRGIRVQRKDKDGNIVKKINDIGPSSWFGWGCVDDTIPGLKKDLDYIKKNFESILDQVTGVIIIDEEDDDEIEQLFVPPPSSSGPLIDQWYQQWARAHDIGDLGMVPDCYNNNKEKPTLEEIMQSQVGCVMKHFCKFVRNKFA